ncbi:MAG: hypothetical protein AAF399_16000 [Bacteroidota bacterium]
MKSSKAPWIIAVLMGMYVYGLTYYARHRVPPGPAYEFYDTTQVKVFVEGEQHEPLLFGRYNNILEGQRKMVQAVSSEGSYHLLKFEVNSPRPATLFVNDEALEIILMPGDTTLKLHLWLNPESELIDSVVFLGKGKGACAYLQDKADRFEQTHIRANRHTVASGDFEIYANKLDSLAARELAFLAEQEVFATLPDWFVGFEKNEILYQKAYLKLSAAFNREVDESLLDEVKLDNSKAVFSYYYYLYLTTYLKKQIQKAGTLTAQQIHPGGEAYLRAQLNLADEILSGEPKDVFLTRAIFQQIQQGNLTIATELMKKYDSAFSRQKYSRFLKSQLEQNVGPV